MLKANAKSAPTEGEDVLEDSNLEDEGLETEDVEDVEEDLTEESDAENEEEDTEDEEEDSTDDPDTAEKPAKFDKKQQEKVNRLIQERLDRQEAKMLRDVSSSAGVDLKQDDITNAARLWGLLKSNPKLSKDIDVLISTSLSDGTAIAPTTEDSNDARTQRLELKEAILDLKDADSTFAKNSAKILAWAEKEGYTVKDAKSLKLVYGAWKGTQGKVTEAIQKTTAQRKQEAKKTMQKRATVQTTKSGTTTTAKPDYRKMSDKDVLQSEGLKLFTRD